MKKFIYFPVNKNGEGLKDSRGKVRFYKDILTLVKSCKHRNYDYVEVYAKDDILSREECLNCNAYVMNAYPLKKKTVRMRFDIGGGR